jgi:hypothetical protein
MGPQESSISPSNLEHELLCSLLTMWSSHPSLMDYCSHYLHADHFQDPMARQLWGYLKKAHEQQQTVDFSGALLEESIDFEPLIQVLGNIKPDWTKFEKHLQEVVHGLVSRLWNLQAQRLRLEIQSGRLKDEEALELAQKYAQLRQQLPQVEVFKEKGSLL